MKPMVFVAAKYESTPLEFLHGLVKAADALTAMGVVPVLPHYRGGIADRETRLGYEYDLINRCDALVIVGGRDPGDHDLVSWESIAEAADIPVFTSPAKIVDWVKTR